MTLQNVRLKIVSSSSVKLKISNPNLKLRTAPRIPRTITGSNGIDVTSASDGFAIALNFLEFGLIQNFDANNEFVAVVDGTGRYGLVSIAQFLGNVQNNVQVVTGAGDVIVAQNTNVLVMKRAVNQNPSNIILPLAVNKIGKIKIVDFNNNASAFQHTIKTTAPDTFQGGATQWQLAGDGASVLLDPIPNLGYAV